MKINRLVLTALFATLLTLGACGRESDPRPTTTVTAPVEPHPTETLPPATSTPTPVAQQPVTFSYSPPESQGLSSEALEELTEIVQDYFEEGKIVGAELVVIQNRQIVLHEAIGWQDREEQLPPTRARGSLCGPRPKNSLPPTSEGKEKTGCQSFR